MALLQGFAHLVSQESHAQADTVRIPYRISCPTCKIELQHVVTLGRATDPVLLADRASVARDSQGRYFATSYDAAQFVVFDSVGRFITAVGRRGRGPGEIGESGISAISIGIGDTVYVLDGQTAVSVYSPDFKLVRSYELQGPLLSGLTSRGTVVGSGPIFTSAGIGFDFHQFDASGNRFRSFGRPRRDVRPGDRPPYPIPFALSFREDALWGSIDGQYVVGRFTIGEPRTTMYIVEGAPFSRREPMVRAPDSRGLPAAPSARPSSPAAFMLIEGEDPNGLIWLTWSHPPVASSTNRRLTLEILDPKLRQIVSSQPIDQRIRLLKGGGLVYASRRDNDGVLSFIISRPRLSGTRN